MPDSSPQPERLSGTVERVTFHSEESGFSVLKVHVKGQREPVTVVGRAACATPGEHLVAEGTWFMDRSHGLQFKAESLSTTPPDSVEGIEKFLGSGMVKGIGPVYAKKLVEHFGRDVLDVIDQRSALLEQVEGIGPTRRRRIKESWHEAKAVREIMTFLMSHGVSTARAFRIHKTYGDEAIARVQADPYCLARDIRGIGFKTADEIAAHFQIARDSDTRARAGIEHVLLELTHQGHVACPRRELVEKASELLGIDPAILDRAVEHGLLAKRLCLETRHGDEPLIYLSATYRAECELADDLRALKAQPPPCPDIKVDKALAWVQAQLRIELAPQQREAVRKALTAKVMVITGGPGVGKTTLVNAIVRIFRARKKSVVLAAPTGRAAKRMSETSGVTAKTLHRLLAYDPASGGFKHDRERPLHGDVFVVDESSMLDIHLAHQLVRAIPGHAALILVGDIDQLPSVGPGTVLRDVIDSGGFPVTRLTEVFRQAQSSAIITNAHRIHDGQFPFTCTREKPGDFYLVPAGEPEAVLAKISALMGGLLEKRFGFRADQDVQILTPMQRGELGARNLNAVLQGQLNPSGPQVERFGQIFREGDRVMQVLNNYDKDVYNGDMGQIITVDREEQELLARFAGREVLYPFNELDELQLSYATTIHKAQGSEYPCVLIPLHTQHYMMLQRNLIYTAVTRGKKLVMIIGSEKALAMAVQRQEASRRIGCLRQRIADDV